MSYAIDLTPRQSARTLEQAIRHHALIVLEPRTWSEDEWFVCRIERAEAPRIGSRGGGVLVLTSERQFQPTDEQGAPDGPVRQQPLDRCPLLIGTYCDASLQLGEVRYLLSAEVVEVSTAGEGSVRIHITRPEHLQVSQRRRYCRFRPARSAQVELRWLTDSDTLGGGVAWLCNVSAEGLACRTDARIGDQLCIGDEVKVDFTLAPGDPQHFSLDAVICNKMPGGSEDKLLLGLQFLTGPGYENSARGVDALRHVLLARYALLADAREGADA